MQHAKFVTLFAAGGFWSWWMQYEYNMNMHVVKPLTRQCLRLDMNIRVMQFHKFNYAGHGLDICKYASKNENFSRKRKDNRWLYAQKQQQM